MGRVLSCPKAFFDRKNPLFLAIKMQGLVWGGLVLIVDGPLRIVNLRPPPLHPDHQFSPPPFRVAGPINDSGALEARSGLAPLLRH